ncbi:MAG TPA: hypothetical protein VJZ70_06240 [Limnochordia bacterium]|jgi:uncharacterized membrane protein|nr:hypothetical protein [Bacillota bacterium]HKM43575.1 hypothetical protein [Limnochordia bacterium]
MSVNQPPQTERTIPHFSAEDVEKNKTMAGLAYLLFFLPLIVCPDSQYAKFHANQALLLWILGIAGSIILGLIPIIGWILIPFFSILVFVLGIIGLVNGLNGKAKELPVIGKYTILK